MRLMHPFAAARYKADKRRLDELRRDYPGQDALFDAWEALDTELCWEWSADLYELEAADAAKWTAQSQRLRRWERMWQKIEDAFASSSS